MAKPTNTYRNFYLDHDEQKKTKSPSVSPPEREREKTGGNCDKGEKE